MILQIIPILTTSTLWNKHFVLLILTIIVFLTISNILLNTWISLRIYFSAHKMQYILANICCFIQPKLYNILFQSFPAGFAFIRIRVVLPAITDFFIWLKPHTDFHILSSIMYSHKLISISASQTFVFFWISNLAFREYSSWLAIPFFI